MTLTTNRDLYLAIGKFRETYKSSTRTLEQYLLALLRLTRPRAGQSNVTISDFYQFLSDAFTAEPAPFDPAWISDYEVLGPTLPGYRGWEAAVVRQIVDLHDMDAAGTLTSEYRYFGQNAPRGSPWYNFDPFTYLECGAVGSFGGWEPDDPTERELVPGNTVIIDPSGDLQVVAPADVARPVFAIPQFSWESLLDFIECGQMYE